MVKPKTVALFVQTKFYSAKEDKVYGEEQYSESIDIVR